MAAYCRLCGRRLTDPESVRLRVGPKCRGELLREIGQAQKTRRTRRQGDDRTLSLFGEQDGDRNG